MTILSTLAAVALVGCENPVDVPTDVPDGVSLSTNTPTGDPLTAGAHTFASTNALNETGDLPHVLFEAVGVEQVTLKFVNNTNSLAFFEVRIDGEVLTSGSAHPVVLGDFIYPGGICVDGRATPAAGCVAGPELRTFSAGATVDIRLALGGERDWDFDWTRFYVLSLANKDQCKSGDWEALGFANQGQCVRYVETGHDSRTGG
jgi:hypothetical protein